MELEAAVQEAVEIVVGGSGQAGVVLCCEHASNRMPAPWAWNDEDQWLVNTHWAVDIGAAKITRALAEKIGAVGVLARYSRLLIDPNRSLTAPSLFRQFADGKRIRVNIDVGEEDAQRRIDKYWRPYHEALDGVIGKRTDAIVLAIHSFTPVFEGSKRTMEVGVLFDHDEVLGRKIATSLSNSGLRVALNEPYSGEKGMMFSAYRHAAEHGRAAIELETRQDLAGDSQTRPFLVDAFAKALADAGVI